MKRLVLLIAGLSLLGPRTVCAAEFLFGTPVQVESINSSRSEYGSTISSDGRSLYFSRGSNSCLGCDSDIFVSHRNDANSEWGLPERLSDSVNTQQTDGVPSISSDGLSLYYSDRWSGHGRRRREGFGGGDLWVSQRPTTDTPWSESVNVGEPINTRYEESGATISSDGRTLYFASTRPNGAGRLDIWYAEREDRESGWSEPENLEIVNGPGREFAPKISPDGNTLFFSAGPNSAPWARVWMTTRQSADEPWGTPVSLGPTINDHVPGGERVGHLSADSSKLYFASWNGSQEFDIFAAPVLPFESVSIRPGSDAYQQDFDEALGADGREREIPFPPAWTTSRYGYVFGNKTQSRFPEGSTIRSQETPIYNAGPDDGADRTLAIGVQGDREPRLLQLSADVAESDASGFELQFDLEAWDATRSATSPGEAAFDVTVELDAGDGFAPLVDLGTVSTGAVLQIPEDRLLDGNSGPNRVTYDSGIQSASIPVDSTLRVRWSVPEDSASSGWIYGLDNVALRLLHSTATGDLNGDGACDVQDIDLLTAAIQAGIAEADYDLNQDSSVDSADRRVWVRELKNTYFGDANLDGEFNSADLVVAFQGGQYEDAVPMNSSWATGDWDGDGEFASSDLVLAFQGGGYEQGPRATQAQVPEPDASLLLLLATGVASIACRRNRP